MHDVAAPLLRAETSADVAAVHEVVAAAFDPEDVAGLVDELRAADALSVSVVAEDEGRVVGYVGVSPVIIDGASDTKWFQLSPVAVHPEYQNQGIGAALVLKALRDTAALGGCGMLVLGEPAYYGRFGFTPSTDFGLAWEKGGGSYFQAVKLSDTPVPRGTVSLHPAFAGY